MELDELKSAWAQYDKKLSQTLKVNEELLRKINLNSSRRKMQKPLIYELISVVGMFIFIAYAAKAFIRFIDEPKYCIPALIVTIVSLLYFVFAIIKVNRFLKIDYYGAGIIKLQRDIALLNKLILRLRKIELVLTPFLVLSLLPVVFKSVHNVDLYSHPQLFIIEIILALGIGFPLVLLSNKFLYDKQFKNTERLLSELDQFEIGK